MPYLKPLQVRQDTFTELDRLRRLEQARLEEMGFMSRVTWDDIIRKLLGLKRPEMVRSRF